MNVNVITVSREYGAGGYELAQQLSASLGWELLDRELLHQAAALEHLPDAELERLDEKAGSLADRFRFHPPHEKYIHGLREVALQAAAKGNVVLVGRGSSQLIPDRPNVLHLRLVAPLEWRARRMAQRENWTVHQALARCTEEDRIRDRFTRYFFGEAPFQPASYALVANTGRMPISHVVSAVSALARGGDDTGPAAPSAEHRVLTLSRELGAGDSGFALTLADRLGLRNYDRDLLEQEAIHHGLTELEFERIDDHSAGIFDRFRPGSLYQRYFETLEKLMCELAERGSVLLVGRGGSRFLVGYRTAFHVRLIAAMDVRIRRVMEHRWLRENLAHKLIAESDEQRRRFNQSYFGADWSSPLEYHLTVNSGRLGPAAVDLIADAAARHWERVTG
jgi:CMP/dCMP kinase